MARERGGCYQYENKRILDGIGQMFDYIYKNSSTILVSSERFVEAIVKRHVNKKFYFGRILSHMFSPISILMKTVKNLSSKNLNSNWENIKETVTSYKRYRN